MQCNSRTELILQHLHSSNYCAALQRMIRKNKSLFAFLTSVAPVIHRARDHGLPGIIHGSAHKTSSLGHKEHTNELTSTDTKT